MPVNDPEQPRFGDDQDPDTVRRTLLVTALAFMILISWNAVVSKLYPPAKPTAQTRPMADAELAPAGPGGAGAVAEAVPASAAELAAPRAGEPGRFEVVADDQERTSVIVTDMFEATFTNRGGRLRSLKLRGYPEELPGKGEPPRPLEAIPREMIERDMLPLGLEVPDDEVLTGELERALFMVEPSRLELGPGQPEGTVRFHYRSAAGVDAVKEITFRQGSYLIGVEAHVTALPGSAPDVPPAGRPLPVAIEWGPGFSNPPTSLRDSEGSYGSYDYFGRAIYHTSGRTYRSAKGSMEKDLAVAGQVSWAGLEERYFAVVVLPDVQFERVTYRPYRFKTSDGKERTELTLVVDLEGPAELFVGPKKYEILKSTHPALPDVIDFGRWLGPLAKLLLFALNRIEAVVGNYGFAIILLTLLIKVALMPLTLKSFKSMKRVQKLQPKVQAIRDRYKRLSSDPTERREQKMRMNEEVMALYKKEGANPVGGCFPMLLQMPFLFAFYTLLSVAIELRQEPFLFWIHDLSQKDPIYITPVLMTLAQYLSQRLTPATSPDPTQQRMMTFMPLFFLFIFVKVPSGLVIYWLTSNLFQIGQQLVMNRLDPTSTAAKARS